MRLTLTSTLTAAALAFPQFAPSYAHAQPSPPPSAASMAKIHDGKAEVNSVSTIIYWRRAVEIPSCCCRVGSTSYMWRFVMPQLVARGYTVLAPDLRRLGDTTKPATGYDKATVAGTSARSRQSWDSEPRTLSAMISAGSWPMPMPRRILPKCGSWRSSTSRCQASRPGMR